MIMDKQEEEVASTILGDGGQMGGGGGIGKAGRWRTDVRRRWRWQAELQHLDESTKSGRLTAKQDADRDMVQPTEARMEEQAAQLADLMRDWQRIVVTIAKCSASMTSLKSHLLSIEEGFRCMEEATTKVPTCVFLGLQDIRNVLPLFHEACLDGFHGPAP
ncbi:hypothetical protein ACLOJK_007396 [Asimina triloba]